GSHARAPSTTTISVAPSVTSKTTTTSGAEIPVSGPITSTTAGGRILTGAGTTLTPPLQPTMRAYNPRAGCSLLVDPGWTANCGEIVSGRAAAVWVAENRQPSAWTETRLLLWTISDKGARASLRLRAATAGDSMMTGSTVDFGDGDQKVLFSTATVG